MGLLDMLFPEVTEAKAATGRGVLMVQSGAPLLSVTRDPLRRMKDAQAIAVADRWIRAADRAISNAFSTVPYHLEDDEDQPVTDESPENLRAIRDLLERPYTPAPGDPVTNTPRTRAGLWSITSRHMRDCGVAYWYLDQADALAGMPLQLLYINPARMKAATDDNDNLLGWVLDPDARGGGTPLEREKVLRFPYRDPDWGWYPEGLVESAMNVVSIGRNADAHSVGTLAAGGKLTGVFSPKESAGTIPSDVFEQLERDLRTVMDGPDAARRSMILKGPIDFTRTAATPSELDLVAILSMARDDKLGLWGVPGSQLGINPPAGLNSGSTKSYDEAAFWQKTVGPELDGFAEVIQYELLDRTKALGFTIELVIEKPTFDDEMPKFDMAVKASSMPLRNIERRELLGLEPFGDPVLDNAVWMPITIQELALAPEAVKARVPGLDAARDRSMKLVQRDVARVLDAMRKDVASRITQKHGHLTRKPTDDSVWWRPDHWRAELEKALRPHLSLAAETVGAKVEGRFGKADEGLPQRVLSRLLKSVGARIGGILDTTRDMVRAEVEKGIKEGLSPAELGDRIEAAAAFDEYRAEMIARTETATVLNNAAVASYQEFGVSKVTVIDGDQDDICASVNGQTWSIEEAESNPIGHPNCVRDFAPVIGGAS